MQLSPEQQQALDAQKVQCPFCKIVKGEIQSKKVYEDDKVLAILDINPATRGHLLVMPKEHYPIMPFIPPDIFDHLFAKTKLLSKAVKEGLLLFGDTIYVANGYAAGQQSSHFMLHIIPREEMDGLEFFTLKKGAVDPTKTKETVSLLKQQIRALLRQRYVKYPLPSGEEQEGGYASEEKQMLQQPAPKKTPSVAGRQYTKETLIELIESNPQLNQLITYYPEDFKKQVQQNPRLQQLFTNINIDDVIAHFVLKKEVLEESSSYSMDELVDIIHDNPKLRDLLLKQTLVFAETVQKVPELKRIFAKVNIEELERAVLARDVQQEEDVVDILKTFSKEHVTSLTSLTPQSPIQEQDQSIVRLEEQEDQEEHESISNEVRNGLGSSASKSKEKKQGNKKQKEKHKEKKQEDEEAQESSVDAELLSKLHAEFMRGKK